MKSKAKELKDIKYRVMGFDPGNSTGICIAGKGDLLTYLIKNNLKAIHDCMQKVKPDIVVIEDFRLYANKAREQIGSDFYTVRVIGAIELTAKLMDVPYVKQGASIKNFTRLEGCPSPACIHEQDAYRHVWYYAKKKGLF